ncbi:site-specific integrase, partial [Candidatus Bathyarchaeota archaeon]
MVNNGILLKEVQHGILKSVDPISDSLSVGAKSKIDLHACMHSNNYGKHYRLHRNKLAKRLHKPELRTIRLYDFRHYFATMLYSKTRDILLVKQQMGHRKIETTLIYTQLLNLNDDEWTCRTANNIKDATQLIENG